MGAGPAWADEAGSHSPPSDSSAAKESPDATPKTDHSAGPPKDADPADTGTETGGATAATKKSEGSRRPTPKSGTTVAHGSHARAEVGKPAVAVDRTPGATTTAGGSATKIDAAVPPTADNEPAMTAVAGTISDPAGDADPVPVPKRSAPNVVTAAVGALSSFVGALFKPWASHGPQSPAAEPQLWTMLASARREFEARQSATDRAAAAQTTGQTIGATALVTATEAPEAQAAAVQNSLTYTAPPTFSDRLTLFAMRVARVVSNIIGIDIYGEIAKLIAGSDPPFFVKYGLDVHRADFEVAPGNVWKVWEFTPPDPTGKTVMAVHGGGFVLQPLVTHWIDYSNMARQTGATVVVPLYPLATTEGGTALQVVPGMADFLSYQIALHGAENVSVYADSAGPNLALSAVRELILRGEPIPASMVLISFAPDATLSNPDIKKTDDPIIDVNNLDFYAANGHWSDGITDRRDPILSPLFMEPEVFQALPPTTIYVGSTEFLLPDTLLLYNRAVAEGVPISVVVGTGQIHDWPLGGLPINSQAPKVRRDIYRQLGLIPVAT
ncbi:alpha/beta hydrolase fold domain-containing protein [Mycobacterium sp. BMJ-28]